MRSYVDSRWWVDASRTNYFFIHAAFANIYSEWGIEEVSVGLTRPKYIPVVIGPFDELVLRAKLLGIKYTPLKPLNL